MSTGVQGYLNGALCFEPPSGILPPCLTSGRNLLSALQQGISENARYLVEKGAYN